MAVDMEQVQDVKCEQGGYLRFGEDAGGVESSVDVANVMRHKVSFWRVGFDV